MASCPMPSHKDETDSTGERESQAFDDELDYWAECIEGNWILHLGVDEEEVSDCEFPLPAPEDPQAHEGT